jgi:hypothetical protein
MKPFTIRKAAQPVKGQHAVGQEGSADLSQKYATAPAHVGGEED